MEDKGIIQCIAKQTAINPQNTVFIEGTNVMEELLLVQACVINADFVLEQKGNGAGCETFICRYDDNSRQLNRGLQITMSMCTGTNSIQQV